MLDGGVKETKPVDLPFPPRRSSMGSWHRKQSVRREKLCALHFRQFQSPGLISVLQNRGKHTYKRVCLLLKAHRSWFCFLRISQRISMPSTSLSVTKKNSSQIARVNLRTYLLPVHFLNGIFRIPIIFIIYESKTLSTHTIVKDLAHSCPVYNSLAVCEPPTLD
jgi:hypothetical protein